MTIDEILEMMDDMLDKAVTVPFSGKKCMIDADKLREYIDNIRYNLPTEIMRAKEIAADRSEIFTSANAQAEEIIKRAEERAKLLVSEEEIVKQAKATAEDLVSQAKAMEASIRKAMVERLDSVLGESEKSVSKTMNEIKAMREAIQTANKQGEE